MTVVWSRAAGFYDLKQKGCLKVVAAAVADDSIVLMPVLAATAAANAGALAVERERAGKAEEEAQAAEGTLRRVEVRHPWVSWWVSDLQVVGMESLHVFSHLSNCSQFCWFLIVVSRLMPVNRFRHPKLCDNRLVDHEPRSAKSASMPCKQARPNQI